MNNSDNDRYEIFLKLYQANEKRIFWFILALLPNYSAAEDIMQDTVLIMWKKFDQYTQGTNFSAWGMQIARFAVLQYRRKHKSGFVHFDTNALEKIIQHKGLLSEKEDIYADILEQCTKSLKKNSKKIVSLRYVDNMKIVDIALEIGKTVNATYQAMFRIHRSLLECIERKLSQEEMV